MGRGARVLIDRLRMRQDNVKSLGQHFLNNEEVLDETISLADISADDNLIEIGPGPGVLTERLLESGCTLTAIELDSGICEFLRDNFPDLNLIEGDALKETWPEANKVVANIPYQISSPLIDIITRTQSIDYVVILVQEEFAERLTLATPADRGSLGICTALGWSSTMDRRVPPGSFRPPPAVMSRVCVLRPIDLPGDVDHRLVRQTVHAAFHHRRRKLRTSLQRPPRRLSRLPGWHAARWKHAMASLGQDAVMDQRPEDLTVEEWCGFCHRLASVEVQSPS